MFRIQYKNFLHETFAYPSTRWMISLCVHVFWVLWTGRNCLLRFDWMGKTKNFIKNTKMDIISWSQRTLHDTYKSFINFVMLQSLGKIQSNLEFCCCIATKRSIFENGNYKNLETLEMLQNHKLILCKHIFLFGFVFLYYLTPEHLQNAKILHWNATPKPWNPKAYVQKYSRDKRDPRAWVINRWWKYVKPECEAENFFDKFFEIDCCDISETPNKKRRKWKKIFVMLFLI